MRSTSPLRVLLLAWAVVLPSCKPHAARLAPPADGRDESAGWDLVWADEFDADGRPNPGNWTHEIGFVRNEELQWYQPDNAICENGLLVITARRERLATPHGHAAAEWAKKRSHAEY